MFRKFVCCITAICIVMLSCVPALAAASESKESAPHPDIQRIFDDFHTRCMEIESESSTKSRATTDTERLYSLAKSEAIAQLEDAGYWAYDINSNTYDSIEDTLSTDLSQMGLDPNGSYIIVIAGEEPSINASSSSPQSRTTILPSFTHTYNGYTCTLRYVYVTASDYSGYSQANSVSIINNSNGSQIIENALNSLVTSAIDSISGYIPFGTIASICGLSLVNFNTSLSTTMILHGDATWTREYTQVYEENSDVWLSWVSVDYVVVRTFMSGSYYVAHTNIRKNIPDNLKIESRYSEHYNDVSWRKNQAIWGWHLGAQRNEYIGNVSIYHDGSRVMYFIQPMRPAP